MKLRAAVVILAISFAGPALAAESIGGAELVVNDVKGSLTQGKVVNVLQGDDVYRDEGVKTSVDSTTELILRDKTVLTLGSSSFVKLDRFVYAGEGQLGAIAVNVLKGSLTFATGNAEKKSYAITTPTAMIGVRGTIFRIEATSAKTRLVLEEGALHVCMLHFKERCVDLDHAGAEAVVTVVAIAVTSTGGSTAAPGSRSGTTTAPAPAPRRRRRHMVPRLRQLQQHQPRQLQQHQQRQLQQHQRRQLQQHQQQHQPHQHQAQREARHKAQHKAQHLLQVLLVQVASGIAQGHGGATGHGNGR